MALIIWGRDKSRKPWWDGKSMFFIFYSGSKSGQDFLEGTLGGELLRFFSCKNESLFITALLGRRGVVWLYFCSLESLVYFPIFLLQCLVNFSERLWLPQPFSEKQKEVDAWIDLGQSFLIFMYLSLAVLGLHCCARAFSSHRKQGLLVAVWRLLIAVASLVAEHRL